jgi:hypothetical protein
MKTVATWCTVVLCAFALTGCAAGLLVGTTAGAAVGASVGSRQNRASGLGEGKDVGAAVVVNFAVPRDVHAVVMRYDSARRVIPTDSVVVRAVTTLSGRIAADLNDSLVLFVTEANGSRGRVTFGGKHSTAVLRDSDMNVRILNRNPSRYTGLFLGTLVLAASFLGLFLYFGIS